jgi:choline kinase
MSTRHIVTKIPLLKDSGEIGIIIPAAGLGKRMKSRGPKPLIKIRGDTTILKNQLSSIRNKFTKASIALVSGFQSDKLMSESPAEIIKVENELYEQTNVARSLGIGLRALESFERILVVYGDLVFNEDALEVLNYNRSAIFCINDFIGDDEVGCVVDGDYKLEHMMYDLPDKWGQIAYFQGRELAYLKEIVWNRSNSKLFGFEVINKIIEKGGMFECQKTDKIKLIDVDTSKDIERAKQVI